MEGMISTQFWLMGWNAYVAGHLSRAISIDSENRIVNFEELDHALFDLDVPRSSKPPTSELL
jgi:hypothetical protein